MMQDRPFYDDYSNLVSEQQLSNSALYHNFIRMSSKTFEELVCLVGPNLQRFPYFRKDTLVVVEILSCTLRYVQIS